MFFLILLDSRRRAEEEEEEEEILGLKILRNTKSLKAAASPRTISD